MGDQISLTVVVTSDPHQTPARVKGSSLLQSRTSFLAKTESISLPDQKWNVKIPIRVLGNNPDLHKGQRVRFEGRVQATKERRVAALVISATEIEILSPPSRFDRSLNHIRDQFITLARNRRGDGAALIPGVVAGDTRLESQELVMAMRRSGLSHLTAVSGANFAIVTAFVLWLTGWITRKIWTKSIIAVLFVFVFLELVRPSASVLRAAVMALVIIAARASGSRSVSASSLALAIAAVLIADPYQGFDPGFVLSVLATGALIFLAPIIENRLSRYLIPALSEGIAVATSATLICTPYITYLSGEIALGSILFNIAAAPVVAPLTILGFISMAILPIAPVLSGYCFTLAQPLAAWIVWISTLHAKVASISISPLLILLLIAALTLVWWRSRRMGAILLSAILLFFALARFTFPGSGWIVGQCNVGQGDALLVRVERDSAILFDAGPDSRLLQRCLRQFGIRSLPLVIISHHHADHYQGLLESKDLDIGEVWVNSPRDRDEFNAQSVHIARAGESFTIGAIQLKVLWPNSGEEEFSTIAGDGSLENNRSLVVQVKTKGQSILVTGDIEPEAQLEIARKFGLQGIAMLKVPHHGSKYQSPEFLDAIHPSLALISVGAGNTYGHPSAETLDALRNRGARNFRTDRDGAIAISWSKVPEVDEGGQRKYVFSVRKEGREWWRIRWG